LSTPRVALVNAGTSPGMTTCYKPLILA
jgi:hypothetical protein